MPSKSIDDLIAEAEKNRPDVAEDEIAMQKQEESLKSIRSELLPQLNIYGFYAGAGIAGPVNPQLRPVSGRVHLRSPHRISAACSRTPSTTRPRNIRSE